MSDRKPKVGEKWYVADAISCEQAFRELGMNNAYKESYAELKPFFGGIVEISEILGLPRIGATFYGMKECGFRLPEKCFLMKRPDDAPMPSDAVLVEKAVADCAMPAIETPPNRQLDLATDFLDKAKSLIGDRGKQYDNEQGRSMRRAADAFNAVTGHKLTEAECYLLLQIVKDVRQWQNPGRAHRDSLEDSVAYAALKAEAKVKEGS